MDGGLLRRDIGRLHTTPLGAVRIRRNLGIAGRDAVGFCRDVILREDCAIHRRGKN